METKRTYQIVKGVLIVLIFLFTPVGYEKNSAGSSMLARQIESLNESSADDLEEQNDSLLESKSTQHVEKYIYKQTPQGELAIHIHFPSGWKDSDRRPVIIFLCGGGPNSRRVRQFTFQADYLAGRSMVAARAEYRAKRHQRPDGVTVDKCVEDARSAVRWMRKNSKRLGIDPNKLITSGGSGGGHLAACMMIAKSVEAEGDDLSISTIPQAMVLFNPVLSFENEQMIGQLGENKHLARKISPTAHLDKSSPPALILFGTNDSLKVFGDDYWKKAEEIGVRADKYIAEGQGHGFFNRSPWRERTLIVTDKFLTSLGYLKGEPTIHVPELYDEIKSLHQIVADGDIDQTRSLLSEGVEINVKDENGQTALHIAARNNHEDIIELLISQGAVLEAKDKNGNTPLYNAAVAGNEAVVKLLISMGADVNAKDNFARTPLQVAFLRGHKDVAELMISRGADVNIRYSMGLSLLHMLVREGQSDMIKLVIDKGADVNAKNNRGLTALHLAARSGQKEIVELLVAKGADVNAIDFRGVTPLDFARRRGFTGIAELLHRHGAEKGPARSREPAPPDAAIIDVSAPKSCIKEETASIRVWIENRGGYSESCVVKLTDFTDGLEIGNQTVALPGADKPDLILDSPVSGKQHFGWPPAVGDVNGDGYDDVLAPAAAWDDGARQGRAYLYYGGPNMDTTPDKTFTGEAAGDYFGDGAAMGDVNGDKYADVIVAAPAYSGGANDGRVYIFYGGPDMDEGADLILEGESGGRGYYGVAIAAGDVNHDGYDDLIITAMWLNSKKGRAYLYYGGNPMDASCDLTFDGENPNDWFGRTAFVGGDVNGDNFADVLVGARDYPSGSKKGRVYLYYGGNPMDNACDKIFTGEFDGDNFSNGIAIFDIDNDGFGDVLIGANRFPRAGHQGRAYLYWGGPDMDVNADKKFTGETGSARSQLGCYLWGGYINDDEYGDILVGAYLYYKGDRRGRAYFYYGDEREKMDEIPDRTFINDSPRSDFAMKLILGDVNGDGRDDAVINGWQYDNEQGRIWVYYGGASKETTDVTFHWDTIKASEAEHTLKVEILPVPGEQDTADNTKTITVDVREPSQ